MLSNGVSTDTIGIFGTRAATMTTATAISASILQQQEDAQPSHGSLPVAAVYDTLNAIASESRKDMGHV